MTRTIAVANQKGGTGKTVTTINLAAALARRGNRVLLIDIDPQANATAAWFSAEFALGPAEDVLTTYEVMAHKQPIEDAIRPIQLAANEKYGYSEAVLDMLPAHIRLARAEMELINAFRREYCLETALRPVKENYDFILIDCPPSLGILTLNGLIAADEIMIPVEPGYFPIIGINLVLDTVREIGVVTGLSVAGLIPTLQDNTLVSKETAVLLGQIAESISVKLFTGIPKRVALKEATSVQEDIFTYAGGNDAAAAYMKLAEEVERG